MMRRRRGVAGATIVVGVENEKVGQFLNHALPPSAIRTGVADLTIAVAVLEDFELVEAFEWWNEFAKEL